MVDTADKLISKECSDRLACQFVSASRTPETKEGLLQRRLIRISASFTPLGEDITSESLAAFDPMNKRLQFQRVGLRGNFK